MTTDVVPEIIGESRAIAHAVGLARQFAPTTTPVLLVGDTGTGKDLFATSIHDWSGRSGPLVDVNCGGLPKDIIDGILFGHRRGAFTGAVESIGGLIEGAADGTLFLDELDSLPVTAQVKLLRVLESGEVRRVGEVQKRKVEFRIIAGVREEVEERIAAGEFRLDLFTRVAGVVIQLRRLVARSNDTVLLARHFAEQLGRQLGAGTDQVLLNYEWPGNVRELKAAIERAALLHKGRVIPSAAVVEAIALGTPPNAADGEREEERQRLLDACAANEWHAGRTAEALGIGRTTLFRRLREFGISLGDGCEYHQYLRSSKVGRTPDFV